MGDRPTEEGYGMICREEIWRILDGERTRSDHIAQLKDKARECHETAGCEPGASHYAREASRLTKSKVSFSTVLSVWAFVTVECSNRPGEQYPLSCRKIVELSRANGRHSPMLPMRQVQRAALELERLQMLDRWTRFDGIEMWGVRFPKRDPTEKPKRRQRRTPPKKQSVASDAQSVACAVPSVKNITRVNTLQSAPLESGARATTATHAPDSLESWLAAGRRDGVDLTEVEEMWRSIHGTEKDPS